ncbi:MAG: hypothetical protein ACPL2E_07490 [Conexivisphaera sp.]
MGGSDYVYVVKSSDIAKLKAEPPHGSTAEQILGKVFEEEYSFANYIYERTIYGGGWISRDFARKVAARLRAAGVYSPELVARAYRSYAALLREKVTGTKPRTVFRKFDDNIYVAAQPDLCNYDEDPPVYYEVKMYQLNDYARAQAGVFAWVLEEPVVLIGLVEDGEGGGRVRAEREVVNPPDDLAAFVGMARDALAARLMELGEEQLFYTIYDQLIENVKQRWSLTWQWDEEDEWPGSGRGRG